ncbi:MAG: DUF389 domain-containing protein [Deinococcota bacterium]|nr:DUF389 domain-containing protein [Deinococcota bacterium]
MRQLLVRVPRGHGETALAIAKAHSGLNLSQVEAKDGDQALDLVTVHVSNGKVEGLLQDLEDLPDLHVTLIPRGVIALEPPASEAPQQVTDVGERSPIEVFLGGLQSVGSWRGFLGYAAAAGVVVWIGLFTNTIYLLTAAMLIAPFAGPAMNVALATARGDATLLGRGVLRYFSALIVTVAVAAGLSLIFGQEVATEQMIERSQISTVAVLLPLVAGAAGALNLVQSERSSLVSGAATGMLVAASLAPPAGLAGMAAAMGRWDLVVSGVFLLLLQLVGINLSGSVVFRLYGLSARGARYERGKSWLFPLGLATTAAMLAGLMLWQFSNPPELQRPTRAQRATAEVQRAVEESGLAKLIEADVRFTRADIKGQNSLLGVVYVQRRPDAIASPEAIRAELTRRVQDRLLEDFNVTPLIDIRVLEAPSHSHKP